MDLKASNLFGEVIPGNIIREWGTETEKKT